jgi:hypothetical protein
VWGIYQPRRAKVLHLDYEQGAGVTGRRMQQICSGMGLRVEEIDEWWRTAIFPPLNLSTDGAEQLYSKLFEGFGLAIIDSLKAVVPGVEENSSSIRDRMAVLTRASERTGCAVILIHHSGKQNPDRSRKEAGRGSSAIFDELQSAFVLTGQKGEPIHVSHEKDRVTGQLLDDFWLQISSTDDGESLKVTMLDRGQVSVSGSMRTFDMVKSDLMGILRREVIESREGALARCERGTALMRAQAWHELVASRTIVQVGRRWVLSK